MDRIRKSTRLSTWMYSDQNSLLESNRETKVIRKLKIVSAKMDCPNRNTVALSPPYMYAEPKSTIICIEVIQFIMNFYVCVSPDWFTMEDYDELFGSFIRKGVWMVCAQTGPEEVECLV